MHKEVETLILLKSTVEEAVLSHVLRQKNEVVSWTSLAGDTSFHLLW